MGVGIQAATNGIGGQLEYRLSTSRNDHLMSLDIQTLRHPQETKVQNNLYINPKPYAFGKLNNATVLRLSYEFNKRVRQAGVQKPEFSIGLSGGPSLGILKPYYIGYDDLEDSKQGPVVVQQSLETSKNQNRIYGPANWTNGLNEITSEFGVHLNIHFQLKWVNFDSQKCWQTGLRCDYFPKGLSLMLGEKTRISTGLFTRYTLGNK